MISARLILTLSVLAIISTAFRPPAVPLVVQDPYVSIWSFNDHLYDDWPKHWAGGISALAGMINVDGQCYRFMGPSGMSGNVCNNNAQQIGNASVDAATTTYLFQAGPVNLTVTFMTPADMRDLELLSRPITFVTFQVLNTDANPHSVKIYYDNSAEVAIDNSNEQVQWKQFTEDGVQFLSIGTQAQQFNGDQGSDRIDWGNWYVATQDDGVTTTVNSDVNCRGAFAKNQNLPAFDTNMPRKANDNWPVLAVQFDLGSITNQKSVFKHLLLGYDQIYGMQYFGTLFKPFWTQNFANITQLMIQSLKDSKQIYLQIKDLQTKVFQYAFAATSVENMRYTTLVQLAYRQVTGGLQIVWNHIANESWVFMKEISSDGDVSTVDVIYPAAPAIFVFNPELFRKILVPIMVYANNQTGVYGQGVDYNLQWAPHHLGHWPVSYIKPDEQEQMPVEETANMLILIAFIAKVQHNLTYLTPYWPVLDLWGNYLITVLPDPGDQLCTDDFEGPSPHNVNLAAKGIVGLGAYSLLLKLKGDTEKSNYFMNIAQNYSAQWVQNAQDGDHFKLQYDLPNTWSMKYNLYFMEVLGLTIFNQRQVIEKDVDYYLTKLNTYGIPLDSRASFTKTDWSFWVGAMGDDDQFGSIVKATWNFATTTQDRVPFTDWYDTVTARQKGFQARPVIGGIYSRILLNSMHVYAAAAAEMKENLRKVERQ